MNKKLTYICPRCNKTITSLYALQLSYNSQAHEIACKIKTKKELEKEE